MKLKRVYNKYIPFPGYLAMTVVPLVFIQEKAKQRYTPTVNRHEVTHGLQQVEMLLLGLLLSLVLFYSGAGWWSLFSLFAFFILYLLEWLFKIPFCGFNTHKAYRSISFEQEAYGNQGSVTYNDNRVPFNWVKYIFKVKK